MNKNWHLALAILDAVLFAWNVQSFRSSGSIISLILAGFMFWIGYGQLKAYMTLREQEKG